MLSLAGSRALSFFLTCSKHNLTGQRDWHLLPNNQRQHRTLHIQKDALLYALCYSRCPVSADIASVSRMDSISTSSNHLPGYQQSRPRRPLVPPKVSPQLLSHHPQSSSSVVNPSDHAQSSSSPPSSSPPSSSASSAASAPWCSCVHRHTHYRCTSRTQRLQVYLPSNANP